MKPILLGPIALFAALGTALATPACMSGPIQITGSTTLECGGLTFSDFQVTGDTDRSLILLNAEAEDELVDLTFAARERRRDEDMHWAGPEGLFLFFTVAGIPIDWVQLAVASKRVQIETTACGDAASSDSCTATVLAQVASSASSPWHPQRASASFSPSNPVHVLETIRFDNRREGVFSNSFETVVAEPVTAGTIGVGLLLVGWAYRRTRRPAVKK